MSRYEDEITWVWIVITLLIVGMIAVAAYTSPSEAERVELERMQAQQYEVRRNAELKATSGMEDCEYHNLKGGIQVVRCPNSNTTLHYQCGKVCSRDNTIVDGDSK